MGLTVASESSFYRVLHDESLLAHRQRARPRTHHRPKEHGASAPNQVWSWNLTYLRSPVRGVFMYMALDVLGRTLALAEVHVEQSAQLAGELAQWACEREGVSRDALALHADNGAAMKGRAMLDGLDPQPGPSGSRAPRS